MLTKEIQRTKSVQLAKFGKPRNALEFFAAHPVFTTKEFADAREATSIAVKPLLAYHRRAGHVVSLRRGLYAAIRNSDAPDPLLVAAKMADDAVLAYGSALAWHGLAHSVQFAYAVLSRKPTRPASIGGVHYQFVLPSQVAGADGMVTHVEQTERQGVAVRVTNIERTLVDCLDRPSLCGGWEEVLNSLDGLSGIYLDGTAIVDYALALRNATLAAKVGYFLERNQTGLVGVNEAHISCLQEHAPRTPHYATRERRGSSHLAHGWNLLVPVLANGTQDDRDREENTF